MLDFGKTAAAFYFLSRAGANNAFGRVARNSARRNAAEIYQPEDTISITGVRRNGNWAHTSSLHSASALLCDVNCGNLCHCAAGNALPASLEVEWPAYRIVSGASSARGLLDPLADSRRCRTAAYPGSGHGHSYFLHRRCTQYRACAGSSAVGAGTGTSPGDCVLQAGS